MHKRLNDVTTELDPTVFNWIPHRSTDYTLNSDISLKEIRDAVLKMKDEKAAGPNKIPAEAYKALAKNDKGLDIIHKALSEYWMGKDFERWKWGKLVVLPKKGDLSDGNSWRGIMLLDVANKILSSIISARLGVYLEVQGLDIQSGFTKGKGCRDGIFNLQTILQRRRDAGLDTHVLFIDLIKAFDTVPREGLYTILIKMGIPKFLVKVIKRMHTGCMVEMEVGGEKITVTSTLGVKQGDNLAPVLFLIYIQAALEALIGSGKLPAEGMLWFRTKEDGIVKRNMAKGGKVCSNDVRILQKAFWSGAYADDCGFGFSSRSGIEKGTECIYQFFKRFGLSIHVGRNSVKSKTEALLISGKGSTYESGDSSDIVVDRTGFIAYAKNRSFKFLGSTITWNLSVKEEVSARINSASSAFGALKPFFDDKGVDMEDKCRIYKAKILPFLLYNCENWCLSSALINRLRVFHRRCIRRLCRVSMFQTAKYHISSISLEDRTDISDIHSFVAQRFLSWIGKIARDPMQNLTRQLLSSWIYKPQKTLIKNGVNGERSSLSATLFFHLKRVCDHDKMPQDLKVILLNKVTDAILNRADAEGRVVEYWYTIAQDRLLWKFVCACSDPRRDVKLPTVKITTTTIVNKRKALQINSRYEPEAEIRTKEVREKKRKLHEQFPNQVTISAADQLDVSFICLSPENKANPCKPHLWSPSQAEPSYHPRGRSQYRRSEEVIQRIERKRILADAASALNPQATVSFNQDSLHDNPSPKKRPSPPNSPMNPSKRFKLRPTSSILSTIPPPLHSIPPLPPPSHQAQTQEQC